MKNITKAYEELIEVELDYIRKRIDVLRLILENPILLYTSSSKIEAFLGNEREIS